MDPTITMLSGAVAAVWAAFVAATLYIRHQAEQRIKDRDEEIERVRQDREEDRRRHVAEVEKMERRIERWEHRDEERQRASERAVDALETAVQVAQIQSSAIQSLGDRMKTPVQRGQTGRRGE